MQKAKIDQPQNVLKGLVASVETNQESVYLLLLDTKIFNRFQQRSDALLALRRIHAEISILVLYIARRCDVDIGYSGHLSAIRRRRGHCLLEDAEGIPRDASSEPNETFDDAFSANTLYRAEAAKASVSI